jgi:hypothetical protein
MVFNRAQHPTPQPHTVLYFDMGRGGGGGVEPGRRLEGHQFAKLGRKYQHVWLYLQSVNFDKHLPQGPFTDNFLDDDIFLWCILYIVRGATKL